MESLPPIEIDPEKFLREHCTLPMLPTVISRIQNEMQGANIDTNKVVNLIQGDPALVAQILKVVNSGYYGLPREISKVRFAITFLGLNEIYRMVLSLSVINTINIKDNCEISKFWYHSFYTALCTKLLAKHYENNLSFEELWSAAILHDIGKLVYLKFFPDHYRTLKRYSEDNGTLFIDAENHFGLPASSNLGSLLCKHWRLPDKIAAACEHHSLSDLAEIDTSTLSGAFRRMICLGNLTAILSTDSLTEENKQKIAGAITTSLGCGEEEFISLMGEMYELKIEAERFMAQF